MIRIVKRLAHTSIWGNGSVAPGDARVDGLLRVALPALDILIILFGVFGFLGGIPALRDVFSDAYAEAWSMTLAVTALAALVGLAFPAYLWRVELYAKAFLISIVVLYAFALAVAGIVTGDLGRGAVTFVPLGFVVLPTWRVFDIPKEVRRHGWH